MGFTEKEFIDNLETDDNDIVITDTAAGVEHFGRGLDRFADVILMVIDPSYESIRLSEKIRSMGDALGKPVYFVLNKTDAGQEEMMRDAISSSGSIIAAIPADKEILMAGLKGEPLELDLPEINTIIERIGC